jgi:hypothetical protein
VVVGPAPGRNLVDVSLHLYGVGSVSPEMVEPTLRLFQEIGIGVRQFVAVLEQA